MASCRARRSLTKQPNCFLREDRVDCGSENLSGRNQPAAGSASGFRLLSVPYLPLFPMIVIFCLHWCVLVLNQRAIELVPATDRDFGLSSATGW